eukprot:9275723-Pyramimonas_sp.AAC.1
MVLILWLYILELIAHAGATFGWIEPEPTCSGAGHPFLARGARHAAPKAPPGDCSADQRNPPGTPTM